MDYLHQTILQVWKEDIRKDYEQKYLLKEDTLKNAFYFHLRRRLGEGYLHQKNLRIYTEYYIKPDRVDLVVVQIDPEKADYSYLGDSVIKVLASIEMKYKSAYANDKVFTDDVLKVIRYINDWGQETKHYLAVVQEKYYESHKVKNWITDIQAGKLKNQVTELLAYWDYDTDETVWRTVEH